jgi:polysaccharide biosynthesis protein PslH
MNARLQILLLSRFRPGFPTGGAALRNWQNVHGLARLGPVDVLSVSETVEPAATPIPPVREWIPLSLNASGQGASQRNRWRARLWFLRPGVHPWVDRYRQPQLRQAVADVLARRRYDVVVVEELSLAAYLPALRKSGARVVFDAHNIESRLRAELAVEADSPLRRIKRRWRDRRLWQEERSAVRQADVVWACSERDARELEGMYRPRQIVDVVPNGLNCDDYLWADAVSAGADWRPYPLTLSFLGTYSYRPNHDAAMALLQDILPRLRAAGHSPRLRLIGRDPSPALQAAAAADPDVTVTGAVDSILPYLGEPSIVTLPIARGSGTRLKILEAFATGRPVVSSSKGAEGLNVVDGEHLLLRDDPAAMTDAVLALWSDAALRRALCSAAKDLLVRRYSWESAAQAIEKSLVAHHVQP